MLYDANCLEKRVHMKKYHRFVSFLIIISLFITYSPVNANAAASKSEQSAVYTDSELARAVSLGFGTYEKNVAITYKKFFLMLDNAVKLANPKALTAWKKKFTEARKSIKTIKRDEGMLAIFYKDIYETGVVIFNDGESWANRKTCEVSWIGGSIGGYSGATLGTDRAAVIRFGDGIYVLWALTIPYKIIMYITPMILE